MTSNDLHDLFEQLETILRQRISQVMARLGSEIQRLAARVGKNEVRLDNHEEQLSEHDKRLDKLDRVIGWKPRRQTQTDKLRADTEETAKTIARRMVGYFDLKELRELCWDMDLEYDELDGDTKKQKIEAFVMYFYRRNTLDVLIEWLISERPHVEWPSL